MASRAAAAAGEADHDVVLTGADGGVELHGDRQPDPSDVEVEPRPRVRRSDAEVRDTCRSLPPPPPEQKLHTTDTNAA